LADFAVSCRIISATPGGYLGLAWFY
jgi:hypothetical protein